MLQVVKMTREQKVKMYSKLSKKELIEMLIAANDSLSLLVLPKVEIGELKDEIAKEQRRWDELGLPLPVPQIDHLVRPERITYGGDI